VGEKTKELDSSGFKRWCIDKVRSRNEIGIIVEKKQKKKGYYGYKKDRR
jgi:hypothetical protein